MRRRHLELLPRAVVVVLTLALLALHAPTGSVSRVAAQPIPGPIYGPQEIWLIPHVALTAADGTTTDIVPQLLAAAGAAPGATVDLGGGLSYTDAPQLSGTAIDGAGASLSTIATRVGVLSDTNPDANGAQILTVIASPDVSQANTYIDDAGRISLDLSAVPAATGMTGGTISFVLFETLPPLVPNPEPGLDDLAVFAQRWRGGHFQVLGTPDAGGVLQAAIVQAPLGLPPAATPAVDYARYQQTGAGASWNALGTDGQPQPLTNNSAAAKDVSGPTLIRAVKKSDGPVTPTAARYGTHFTLFFCAPGSGTCILTISGTGSYDTAELPVLGGHVHADITFSAKAIIYMSGLQQSAELLAFKLDETYSGVGNAAGCTTRNLPSVPTPHIMDNHFHDDFNPGAFDLPAPSILSDQMNQPSGLQVNGSISGNWLRDVSLGDYIVALNHGTLVSGEGWQCEKAPGFIVEIGAPALNSFALPSRINLLKDEDYQAVSTSSNILFAILRSAIGGPTADGGYAEAAVKVRVPSLATGAGSGFLDVSVDVYQQ